MRKTEHGPDNLSFVMSLQKHDYLTFFSVFEQEVVAHHCFTLQSQNYFPQTKTHSLTEDDEEHYSCHELKSWKPNSPGTFSIQAAALCNTSKNPVKCWFEGAYEGKDPHFTGGKTLRYSEAALIVEVARRAAGSGNLTSSHSSTCFLLHAHTPASSPWCCSNVM